MKKIVFLLFCLLSACTNKNLNKNLEQVTIQELPKAKPDLALVEKIEEKTLSEKKKDIKSDLHIKKNLPNLDLEEPDDFPLAQTTNTVNNKLFIAVILDKREKDDSILEGAHLAINELYRDKNISLEITRIDLSPKLEDRELDLKELEKKDYQLIITSLPQEDLSFIKAFLHNIKTINLDDCKISLEDQVAIVAEKISDFYLLLPEQTSPLNEQASKILYYSKKNSKTDLKKIAEEIDDRPILFTETNWRLQHLVAELEALDKKNTIIVLNLTSGPLVRDVDFASNLRRVKLVKTQENLEPFIKDYWISLKKKPDLLAWLSYDLVKNFDQERHHCKPKLSLANYGRYETKNPN